MGILQALSSTGVVTWGSAIPIILGQNIGTTSTSLLASTSTSTAARRSAMVHVYFNIIGTAVFLVAIYGDAAGFFPFWNEVIDRSGIANFHTLFNVVVTLLFMPFTKVLAWLAEHTVPEKAQDATDSPDMPVLDQRLISSPAVALQQAQGAVEKTARRAQRNFQLSFGQLRRWDPEVTTTITHREELLDKMEVSITLLQISDQELNEAKAVRLASF